MEKEKIHSKYLNKEVEVIKATKLALTTQYQTPFCASQIMIMWMFRFEMARYSCVVTW